MSSSPVKIQHVPIGAVRPEDRSSKWHRRDAHDTRVKDFVEENELDDRAAAALRGASPDLRDAVMMRGSLRDTRNPSAALLGRLRDASAILAVSASISPLETTQEDLTLKALDGGAAKKRPHSPSNPVPQRTTHQSGAAKKRSHPSSNRVPQRTTNQRSSLQHRLSRLSRIVDHSIQRLHLAAIDAIVSSEWLRSVEVQ